MNFVSQLLLWPWLKITLLHALYCLSSVAYPAVQYSLNYLINDTILQKKKLLNVIKCVFWYCLQFLSQTFLILRRSERYMMKNVHLSSCKVIVFLVRFLIKFNFLNILENYSHIHNPGGGEIFRSSRPALWPTQPPVQWVPGLCRG